MLLLRKIAVLETAYGLFKESLHSESRFFLIFQKVI